MSGRIYISGINEMPRHVRQLGPSHLISIVQPEYQPPRPVEIDPGRHLRIAVHDVSEPDGWSVVIDHDDIRRMIDFVDAWDPDAGDLLVHCLAGVSRSTATALISHWRKTGDAAASARCLREAAPYAVPNRLIISLADEVLGLGGELERARQLMGSPDAPFLEERLATLRL